MAQYDGSINIDTKIDENGFNAGLKKLSDSAQTAFLKLSAPIADFAVKAKEVFTRIGEVAKKILLGVLVLFALSIQKIFQNVGNEINRIAGLVGGKLQSDLDGIKGKFAELNTALAVAFLPLIEFAIPYIKIAVDWLIMMLNKIAMITAAWFGQSQVMQVIAGSAKKTATETQKTEKAARGALAAFDQINVLQQPTTNTSAATQQPEFTTATQMVPVTQDILGNVSKIKLWFMDLWNWLMTTWGTFSQWFLSNVAEPIGVWWGVAMDTAKKIFIETWSLVTDLWKNFVDTWKRLLSSVSYTIKNVREDLYVVFVGIIEFLVGVFTGNWRLAWDGLSNIAKGVLRLIQDIFVGAINAMAILFSGWVNQIGILISHLQQPFMSILNWIRGAFVDAFNFVSGVVTNFVNSIIGSIQRILDKINTVLSAISNIQIPSLPMINAPISTYGYNTSTPASSLGSASGGSVGGGVKIPHLANGAVIPPNNRFMAILGDQTSGPNIESPVSTIRQVVSEELAKFMDTPIDVTLNLDGEAIYKNQQKIGSRRGRSLLK